MKKLNQLLISALVSTSLLSPGCSRPLKTQYKISNEDLCDRLDPKYIRPVYLPQDNSSINIGQTGIFENKRFQRKPSLLELSYEGTKLFLKDKNKTFEEIDGKKDKIENFINKITTFYIAGWKVELKGTGFYAVKE